MVLVQVIHLQNIIRLKNEIVNKCKYQIKELYYMSEVNNFHPILYLQT
jgi:hypothetical protein